MMLAGAALVSCESKTYEDISPIVSNPTYAHDVKPIIDNNCANCHNPDYDQEPYLTTYDQVRDATENGAVIDEISAPSGQGMPEDGRMQQRKIDIITLWAAQGYVNE